MLVDWDLLREQKNVLIEIRFAEFCPMFNDELDGLIHFLDAFQDWSILQGDATEEEVFGE